MSLTQEISIKKQEFERLFKEQRKRLVRLAHWWGLEVEIAADVVQESFAILWTKQMQGERFDSPVAYLLTITKNRVLNILKRRGLEQTIFSEFTEEEHSIPIEQQTGRYREKCVTEKLYQFEKDHPEEGYAIQMQLDGFDITKISNIIGRTNEATRQYLYQIRKKLKIYLIECHESEK
jgi:DNA-directed RNA polymerase specialized sigma24 family protein